MIDFAKVEFKVELTLDNICTGVPDKVATLQASQLNSDLLLGSDFVVVVVMFVLLLFWCLHYF